MTVQNNNFETYKSLRDILVDGNKTEKIEGVYNLTIDGDSTSLCKGNLTKTIEGTLTKQLQEVFQRIIILQEILQFKIKIMKLINQVVLLLYQEIQQK